MNNRDILKELLYNFFCGLGESIKLQFISIKAIFALFVILISFLFIPNQTFARLISSMPCGTVISFDSPDTDTIAKLASLGIVVNSIYDQAQPFIVTERSGPGIGVLYNNALTNTTGGQINAPLDPPYYSYITIRDFEIIFSRPVEAFGFNIQGWDGADHSIDAFDQYGNYLETIYFHETSLKVNDGGPNGFVGLDGNGHLISKMVFHAGDNMPDAVVFDDLIFLAKSILELPAPTVNMIVKKVEISLIDGKFEIKGFLDITDSDFRNIVLNPDSRLLIELQTGGTEKEPEFGVVSEGNIKLITDDLAEELKFNVE